MVSNYNKEMLGSSLNSNFIYERPAKLQVMYYVPTFFRGAHFSEVGSLSTIPGSMPLPFKNLNSPQLIIARNVVPQLINV